MSIRISVIIPNYNSSTIHLTLNSLLHQSMNPNEFEVIVVGKDELELVTTHPWVSHIAKDVVQSAASNRNLGIMHSRGEIVCFTDTDCIPSYDWLERLDTAYRESEFMVIGGGVEFNWNSYWSYCDNISWFYQFVHTSKAGKRNHLPTLNLSMRRCVLDQVGLMDVSFPMAAGEDTEWTQRIRQFGYELHFLPEAKVLHAPLRSNLQQVWKHAYWYGRYSLKIRTHAEQFESSFLPTIPIVFLLLIPVFSLLATFRVVLYGFSIKALVSIPGIYVSKLAWCIGAYRTLQERCVTHLMQQ